MMLAFIDEQRAQGFAVESICRVLREQDVKIAARTYRAWKTRPPAERTHSDAIVVDSVRDLAWVTVAGPDGRPRRQLTPEGLYGRRKMRALVGRACIPNASPGSVDRAMRQLGLRGVTRQKTIRTTIPGKDGKRAGDLLNRDFTATRPNEKWVTDFTYVRTWNPGWAYVCFIVDCFSQRIVAWHAQSSMHTDLVMTPLKIALWARDRQGHPVKPGELITHSDAGAQFTSIRFTEHLALEGIAPSIGSVGDAYDNSLMETINGLYKTECIRTTVFHSGPYRTISNVEYATAAWVDWYNHRRLHSTLGMMTPEEFETTHYQAQITELSPK
jgi:transposase InsO family protein